MQNLLSLTFSPRSAQSCSTQLAERFCVEWRTHNPLALVQHHDMGVQDIRGPLQPWLDANMASEATRTDAQRALLAPSDHYIADLHAASHVLLAMPMYNLSVPWNFKAYVDNIVRVGKTFSFSPDAGYGPLLSCDTKMLVVWSSAGTYGPGDATASMDLLTPYVRQVFGFMGITDMRFVAAGHQWGTPDQAHSQLAAAQLALSELASHW